MKITVVRHGLPEESLIGKLSLNQIPNKLRRYNDSTIIDTPCEKRIHIAKLHSYVICSGLRRSIDSAIALHCEINESDELFNEVQLPYLTRGSIRLHIMHWAYIFRALSVFGFSPNGESLQMAKRRSKLAAAKLISLAEKHDSVLFVGHGIINKLIASELLRSSWVGPQKLDTSHWGIGTYTSKF